MARRVRKGLVPPRGSGGLLASLDHAFRGLLFCLRGERNFLIHVIFALCVLAGSSLLGVTLVEFLLLILVVTLVLVAEIANTALEKTLDLLAPERNIRVREIKNLAAACVLLAAIASLFVGFLLLGAHLPARSPAAVGAVRRSPWYLTVVALLATITLVLWLKVRLRARSLFRGGMPSGHAAFAFAMLVSVFYATESPITVVMVLPLAALVAESRVRRGIHTWLEVVYGGILGAGTATLVFQLFFTRSG